MIDEQGAQLGVLSTREAIQLAEDRGLDLVEVAPQATPPVCKIIDYGKYLYEIKKQQQRAKKKQTVIKMHEIKFGVRTDDHDLDHKIRKIEEFLEEGDKVKATVFYKGRETQYKELGMRVLTKVSDRLKEKVEVESPPRYEGRLLFMILAPSKGLTSKKK